MNMCFENNKEEGFFESPKERKFIPIFHYVFPQLLMEISAEVTVTTTTKLQKWKKPSGHAIFFLSLNINFQ